MISFFLLSILGTSEAAHIDLHWQQSTSMLLGAGASYFLLQQVQPRSIDGVAEPKGVDALVHPQWNPQVANLSDFLGHPLSLNGINLPVLTTLGMGLAMGLQDNSMQKGLGHSLIIAEAIALNASVTEALKLSVARPRPFTSEEFQEQYPDVYSGDFIQHEIQFHDAYKSFPSGHTSSAGATYFSAATLLAHSTDNQRLKIASYSSAAVLTALTGWARVRYGMHHPTDVIAGGLLGAGIGFATVSFHLVQ